MGVRKYRGQIVCDKHWPDGTRTIRVCANKTQAKQLLVQIEASIANGTWRKFQEQLQLRNRNVVNIEDFSEIYMDEYSKSRNKVSSQVRKRVAFKFLNKQFGKMNLESITPAHLHKYVKNRKSKGLSDATVNREITILKHLLNYAVECGVIESNPVEKFKKLKEERKERPRFTEEQVQMVIGAVRADCRPLFIFIRETGCRREEALSLQPWHVQGESQLVVFSENTKSKVYRYVPLTEAAIEAVNTLPRLKDCQYVFYNAMTKDRWHDCRKPWLKARETVGLPEMQVKDLRRHYAIELAESGAAMHDIQQVLGHASVATTEKHYAQFSPKHSAKKILKVLEGGKRDRIKMTA